MIGKRWEQFEMSKLSTPDLNVQQLPNFTRSLTPQKDGQIYLWVEFFYAKNIDQKLFTSQN